MADLPEVESQWTNEGFNMVFERIIKENDITYVEAYRRAELIHVEQFGKIRYSSYESFRGCRHRLLFGK
jgi:hypothetical protein